ncbi:UNVERIFIED_CONTAM: hypothetical protein NCL1_24386 [Trichonephila clavipes]
MHNILSWKNSPSPLAIRAVDFKLMPSNFTYQVQTTRMKMQVEWFRNHTHKNVSILTHFKKIMWYVNEEIYVLQQQGKEKFLLHKKFVSEANSMTFRRGPLACCAVVDNRLLLSSSVSTPLLSHCLPSTVSITCNASFPFRHSRYKKKT